MGLEMNVREFVSPSVFNEFSKLPEEKKGQVVNYFMDKKKSVGMAYLLWLFSCHYIYLGSIPKFLLYVFTACGLFIWFIVDGFRMKKLVIVENDKIMLDCIAQSR